jgi:PAS domain S-box-containing protein
MRIASGSDIATEASEIAASTREAAFAVGQDGKIVAWNRAAERQFGVTTEDAIDRPCHEVVCGRDVFGNRYCHDSCAVLRMARDQEPVRSFEMQIRDSTGRLTPVRVSVLQLSDGSDDGFALLHLLNAATGVEASCVPGELMPSLEIRGGESDAASSRNRLTRRERQVLTLLSEGNSTKRVAERLSISPTTVRNHVQSVLRKLGVHSKLEAVSLALRERIV